MASAPSVLTGSGLVRPLWRAVRRRRRGGSAIRVGVPAFGQVQGDVAAAVPCGGGGERRSGPGGTSAARPSATSRLGQHRRAEEVLGHGSMAEPPAFSVEPMATTRMPLVIVGETCSTITSSVLAVAWVGSNIVEPHRRATNSSSYRAGLLVQVPYRDDRGR